MDNQKMERVVAALENFKAANPHLSNQDEDAANSKAFATAEVSAKRAAAAEKKAAEAQQEQQVLMRKIADMEAAMMHMQEHINSLSRMGAEVKTSLAKGVTAREVLEKFGEKLSNVRN